MEEVCNEDNVMSKDFMKIFKSKGSQLFCDGGIGFWFKLPKSGFKPMNGVRYMVKQK